MAIFSSYVKLPEGTYFGCYMVLSTQNHRQCVRLDSNYIESAKKMMFGQEMVSCSMRLPSIDIDRDTTYLPGTI